MATPITQTLDGKSITYTPGVDKFQVKATAPGRKANQWELDTLPQAVMQFNGVNLGTGATKRLLLNGKELAKQTNLAG